MFILSKIFLKRRDKILRKDNLRKQNFNIFAKVWILKRLQFIEIFQEPFTSNREAIMNFIENPFN